MDARGDADFFIVARTDAEAVLGLEEAVARVTAARELGADGSFIEAPHSEEQMAEIGKRSPHPNVANMIEGGKTPVLPKERLAELGFHLILYPLTGLYAAAQAMQDLYTTLRDEGTTLSQQEKLMQFADFNDLIGVEEKYVLAERYGEN